MNTAFIPETTTAEHYNIATPKGRANLFKKRIQELTKPKTEGGPALTMDQAIFELRTSEDEKDVQLLAAMGDERSKVRTEKLRRAQHNAELTRLADVNARAHIPSREVAAAMVATNARNARSMTFNVRITQLKDKGLTLDQAIDRTRTIPADAALLAAMGA